MEYNFIVQRVATTRSAPVKDSPIPQAAAYSVPADNLYEQPLRSHKRMSAPQPSSRIFSNKAVITHTTETDPKYHFR